MKIMIVDDSVAFRDAIRHLLSKNPAYHIVAEAENGRIAFGMLEKNRPDIILMDIEMPVMNGIQATKLMLEKNKELKIIAISMHHEKLYLNDILNAGFKAFVNKNNVFDQLENAIDNVYAGKANLSNDLKSYF
jgi:DNA-binding NarL/FixJ family response regulator